MNWHYQIIRTTLSHLFLLCLFLLSFCASRNVGKPVICIDTERDALLKFKHHIHSDDCGLMSSWGNPNTPDCCTWKGVSCSIQSGHVIGLNLSGAPYNWGCLYSQVFSPSLSNLKYLNYLDLSSNYFYGMVIPSSIASLVNLIHLNLSGSYFGGNIPNLLGNLTLLTSFDLSRNEGLSAKSLNWLSRLSLLRDINLSGTNLSKATDWTDSIGSLPMLEVLQMDDCKLSVPVTYSSLASANLRIISLSGNDFTSSSIFQWLFNTSNYSSLGLSLEYLDLSGNIIQGTIPDAIGNFQRLMHLDLSYNALSGSIPSTLEVSGALGTMHSLLYLDVSHNRLEGAIPSAMGDSYSISHIDLANNQFQGSIPSSFGNLSSLSYLDLSNNQLEGTIPCSIANLEYLEYLDLSSNYLCGDIPCKIEIREFPYYASFPFQGNPSHCDGDKNKINIGLYVSIGLGFFTGFWAFCGTLTVKNSWRLAYFQFLDHNLDKIYVIVAVNLARFRRNSQM